MSEPDPKEAALPKKIMAGALTASLGILMVDNDDEYLRTLQDAAAAFLRAGGVLSMRDWVVMTASEKAAFIAAQTNLEADRARALATSVVIALTELPESEVPR